MYMSSVLADEKASYFWTFSWIEIELIFQQKRQFLKSFFLSIEENKIDLNWLIGFISY